MSSKRREITACILLVIAAVCWVYGQYELGKLPGIGVLETTAPHATTIIPTDSSSPGRTDPTYSPGELHLTVTEDPHNRTGNAIGFSVCFLSAAMGLVGIFLLRQRVPLLGPDVVLFIPAVVMVDGPELSPLTYFLRTLVVLFSARELFGWIMAKCSLFWCLVHRVVLRCSKPQESLMIYAAWLLAAFWIVPQLYDYSMALICVVIALMLVLGCLWKYGADLNHFQLQLVRFQNGMPIETVEGAFFQAEQFLQDLQLQHQEAIRTAVTSERFKVDLISNVSHDLRTPLTAILGYSELLQKETLTDTGKHQLQKLHLKAAYMSDLVDALFELTKVSSGVMEAKQQKIDLIRLLEQTLGLFDDQLTAAGLVVRRNYCNSSISVVTDGARMHQVFANLLGNAIKYALKGTRIYLEVRENEETVTVRMMNTASYEMDFQPEEIIQRFARGDKTRSTKGSGLGLAIAQTYTASVGGAFRVAVDGDQFSAIVELPKTERNL